MDATGPRIDEVMKAVEEAILDGKIFISKNDVRWIVEVTVRETAKCIGGDIAKVRDLSSVRSDIYDECADVAWDWAEPATTGLDERRM